MRKILELVAFSSLIANKDDYSIKHRNFVKHYRAKEILKEIELVHPNFFPIPSEITIGMDGIRQLSESEKSNNALTRDDFEEIYDKCSEIIHVWKPYNQSPKAINLRLSPN